MKNKKLDAVLIWKQIEDQAVPRLRLSLADRAVYSHLLLHSRFEGKLRLHFSILWLARGVCLSTGTVREAVRRLVAKGALRLVERTKAGHVVEVRLPEEIRTVRRDGTGGGDKTRLTRAADLEETDFLENKELREAIHKRESGSCFYCLRRLTARGRCIDHVVPRVRSGHNSYRNLVSACADCNSQKGEGLAENLVRKLYRQRRLTAAELADRLRALDALAAGKLRPVVPTAQPKFAAGAPKPAPATFKRFPVWSVSYRRKPCSPSQEL